NRFNTSKHAFPFSSTARHESPFFSTIYCSLSCLRCCCAIPAAPSSAPASGQELSGQLEEVDSQRQDKRRWNTEDVEDVPTRPGTCRRYDPQRHPLDRPVRQQCSVEP